MTGRPSKFVPKRIERILEALRLGTTRRAACGAGGICEETLARWMADSEGHRCQIKDVDGEQVEVAFEEAVARAEDEAERRNIAIIQKAAAPHDVTIHKIKTSKDGTVYEETITKTEFDWQASAWWLERRRPKDFGRRVAIAGVEDEPIAVEVTWGDPRMDENTKARNHANGTAEEPTGDDAGARDPGGPEAGSSEGQDQPAGAPPSEPA